MSRISSIHSTPTQQGVEISQVKCSPKVVDSTLSSMEQSSVSSCFSSLISVLCRPFRAVWNWISNWFRPAVQKAQNACPAKVTNEPSSAPIVKMAPQENDPEILATNLAKNPLVGTQNLLKKLPHSSLTSEFNYSQKIPLFDAYHKAHEILKNRLSPMEYNQLKPQLINALIFSIDNKEGLLKRIMQNPQEVVNDLKDPFRILAREFELTNESVYLESMGLTNNKSIQVAIFTDHFNLWLKSCVAANICERTSAEDLAKILLEPNDSNNKKSIKNALEANPVLKGKLKQAFKIALNSIKNAEDFEYVKNFIMTSIPPFSYRHFFNDELEILESSGYLILFREYFHSGQKSIGDFAFSQKDKKPEVLLAIVGVVEKIDLLLAEKFYNECKKLNLI